MCGINGITRKDKELISRMNAVIAHRGPDGEGVYEGDSVTLGHKRLAIIDTSERGAQPMKSADDSLVITYNGELYNYRELRRELSHYPFKSETDTEVILAAYQTWGVRCFKRFNGIFAFGLWDTRKKKLILVRDQVGVKPLYYSATNDAVVFSSEIKALFEAGIPRTLDIESFSRFIRIIDVLGPSTMFRDIKKLQPGHYATITDKHLTITPYWEQKSVRKEHHGISFWHTEIRNTLDAAVKRQLISDRPVGVFLSGGIDSSSVLASVMNTAGKARTYTTRFEVPSPELEHKFNRDAALAKQTASFFGTEHNEITVGLKDIVPLLEQSAWHLDGPTGSATALSQLALAREAANDVTVILGGDGGDELFGGYKHYRLSRYMDFYQKIPRVVRTLMPDHPTLSKLNTSPGSTRLFQFHCIKQDILNKILTPPFQKNYIISYFDEKFPFDVRTNPTDAVMEADLQLLADGALLRTDKLLMAEGLEGRVPILDLEMIALAHRIPITQKTTLRETKKIFKDAMKERLPAYLFEEKKRGWFTPSGVWLCQKDVYAYVKEVLSPTYHPPTNHLFDWEAVTSVLEAHYNGTNSQRILLWTLVSFQVWARQFNIAV